MLAEAPEPSKHWVLDKRVPLALILTLIVQTGGIVWWASGISSRVTSLEERLITAADQPGRIIKLETQIDNLTRLMGRIEDKLDRVLDKP